MPEQTDPVFWRDPALPFIEARYVQDGRKVCYARHAHETFSIGAITAGRSSYHNGRTRETVGAGAVAVMNPEDVHACNPIADEPWSYHMLYVDRAWLAGLQHELGLDPNEDFHAFSTTASTDPLLYAGLNQLAALLADAAASRLHKQVQSVAFFSQLQQRLDPAARPAQEAAHKLRRAAEFISDNLTRPLGLEEICAAAGLSPSYLIRAFQQRYGMTPHAYLVNRRLQYGQAQLRRGRPIVEVALEAGFADQAHFQRTFKRFLAATPGQYQS
ncbi:AraC family transcriptional regulator [Tahibacter harae]|uniref:AraC family transcriptional regulator n=1 Tax=Tahibacter harae TaxID=2963937 RepID=A0ABT1QWM8_9GAMM|nr:AraC family transcriptional regulator [Tahibacter harae]MCQ4166694.1 AraC family transcriptional regulator [Tahibacter harae]